MRRRFALVWIGLTLLAPLPRSSAEALVTESAGRPDVPLSQCEDDILPLRLTRTSVASETKIWNTAFFGARRWFYEGAAYDVPLPNDGYPTPFSLALNRSRCSAHFHFYYTDTAGSHTASLTYVQQMANLLEEAWNILGDEGFRRPDDLQTEGRYTRFEGFERMPVLIFRMPDGRSHSKTWPCIFLRNNMGSTSATPLHELMHSVQYGYTRYRSSWLLEGLGSWSQVLVGAGCDDRYRPMNYSVVENDYCDVAPMIDYLARRYGAAGTPGADVVVALLEELSPVGSGDLRGAMLAFERALDQFGPRSGEYGRAFSEWTAGNYVDQTLPTPAVRAGAPLLPRVEDGGRVGTGGNLYAWREYAFRMPAAGWITVQLRAGAGDRDGDGDDDDIRVKLDSTILADWNTANAFDGAALQGRQKTVHIQQSAVSAGWHTLRLEADESPILHEINVWQGRVPLLLQRSPNSVPPTFLSSAEMLTYDVAVPANVSNLTVLVCGRAYSSGQNLAGPYQAADDDDARATIGGVTPAGWDSDGALDGEWHAGAPATAWARAAVAPGTTVAIGVQANGRPVIQEVAAWATPTTFPLLNVRVPSVDAWGATYHVWEISQGLINSGDHLELSMTNVSWGSDLAPPFVGLMYVFSNGELMGHDGLAQRTFGDLRTLPNGNFCCLPQLGAGGRIVYVVSAPDVGGTYELVLRRTR